MAGFSLKSNLNEVEYRRVRVASQAYVIGDAVMTQVTDDAIDVVPATSSTLVQNILGVAMETVASSATDLLIAIIEPSQVWECEVANTVSAGHNYQRMVLTDANTVNNTGTDSSADEAVVRQVGVAGSKGMFSFIQGGEST
jgi:hypothetical protein